MQITLRKEVEALVVAAAEAEDRTPTNLVNRILSDSLALGAKNTVGPDRLKYADTPSRRHFQRVADVISKKP